MTKVLVIAAHADDEVIGCGGTIARHCAEGDEVQVIYMTDGVSSRATSEAIEHNKDFREESSILACSILGIKKIHQFNFPDNKMDTVPLLSIAQTVESVINKFNPQIVYTHHAGDLNIDHRRTHQATLTACRPQPGFCVEKILAFEIVSSTEWSTPTENNNFIPQYYVDISDYKHIKYQAVAAYESEMRKFPHSRSLENIEAKDKFRGASVGLECAESFSIVREINKKPQ